MLNKNEVDLYRVTVVFKCNSSIVQKFGVIVDKKLNYDHNKLVEVGLLNSLYNELEGIGLSMHQSIIEDKSFYEQIAVNVKSGVEKLPSKGSNFILPTQKEGKFKKLKTTKEAYESLNNFFTKEIIDVYFESE